MCRGKIRYLVLMENAESPERDRFVSQKLCQPTPRNISSTTIAMTTCVNCGSQFLTVKGKKGSKRSLHAKLDSIERMAKDVLEEEFGLTLTPRQKETRFTTEGAPAGRWVERWSTDLAVLCWLNPLNSKRSSIVHSLSLSSARRPDMTKILFKRT